MLKASRAASCVLGIIMPTGFLALGLSFVDITKHSRYMALYWTKMTGRLLIRDVGLGPD